MLALVLCALAAASIADAQCTNNYLMMCFDFFDFSVFDRPACGALPPVTNGNSTATPDANSLYVTCDAGYAVQTRTAIVYIAGAQCIGPYALLQSDTEIYDVASQHWYYGASYPAGPTFRITGALLPNGFVMTVGGFPSGLPAYAYDPLQNTYSSVAAVPSPRMNQDSGTLPDGTVYAVGGFDDSNNVLNSLILYNYTTNTWTTAVATLSVPRSRVASTALADGRIFVAGGIDATTTGVYGIVEISNNDYTQFITVAPLAQPRAASNAVLLQDGNALVMGGRNTVESLDFAYSIVQLYVVANDTWVTRASMHYPRWGASAVVLADGRVVVVGGCDGALGVGAMEFYSPAANTWAVGPTMNNPREFGAIGLVQTAVSFCVETSTAYAWTPVPSCQGEFCNLALLVSCCVRWFSWCYVMSVLFICFALLTMI